MRVAIVGAGAIGSSWATLFLSHGHEVFVSDPGDGAESAMRQFVRRTWASMQTLHPVLGALDEGRLVFDRDLARALDGAEFVQENAPERLELKRDLLARIDGLLPSNVVIASSTSGLLMSEMQQDCRNPQRCVIGHPFNPPHLIPLVEVVGGRRTSTWAVEEAMRVYREAGKTPIRLARELPGHVANRLQAAVWREALYLVQEGVVSASEVDLAMTEGPGLRWALQGPCMTFHLGGGEGGLAHFLAHIQPAMNAWWQDLGEPEMTPQMQQALIAAVQEKTAGVSISALQSKRDAGLLALVHARQTT